MGCSEGGHKVLHYAHLSQPAIRLIATSPTFWHLFQMFGMTHIFSHCVRLIKQRGRFDEWTELARCAVTLEEVGVEHAIFIGGRETGLLDEA